jgi:hypothetical protein
MSRLRMAVAAVAVGLVVATSGCGVSVQEDAQSLPSGALPTVLPSPKPTPTANEDTIFFVSGRGLEGVTEPVNDHSALGVTGAPVLTVVSQTPSGRVVLARTDAFTLLPANDQVLLVGQVVTSLAEVGLTSVIITDQAGLPIPLVLPDGRVLEGPATADDYDALVVDADR